MTDLFAPPTDLPSGGGGLPEAEPPDITGGAGGPPSLADYAALMQQDSGLRPIGVPATMREFNPETGEFEEVPYRTMVRSKAFIDRMVPVEPLYFEGDEWKPGRLPPAERAAIQQAMVQAGVLQGRFQKGAWDRATRTAYTELLAFANSSGMRWEQALEQWAAEAPGEEQRAQYIRGRYVGGEFVRAPFLPEDTDTLTQRIKAQFRQTLGRDPKPGEIGRYVGMLEDVERQAYEAQVAASQATFNAQEQARRRQFAAGEDEAHRQFLEAQAQEYGSGPTGDAAAEAAEMGRGLPIQQPGTFQQHDPVASFLEQWERDYAPEIGAARRSEEAAQGRELFMGSVNVMDALIGGRR